MPKPLLPAILDRDCAWFILNPNLPYTSHIVPVHLGTMYKLSVNLDGPTSPYFFRICITSNSPHFHCSILIFGTVVFAMKEIQNSPLRGKKTGINITLFFLLHISVTILNALVIPTYRMKCISRHK